MIAKLVYQGQLETGINEIDMDLEVNTSQPAVNLPRGWTEGARGSFKWSLWGGERVWAQKYYRAAGSRTS